jgi:hypothetical protein
MAIACRITLHRSTGLAIREGSNYFCIALILPSPKGAKGQGDFFNPGTLFLRKREKETPPEGGVSAAFLILATAPAFEQKA